MDITLNEIYEKMIEIINNQNMILEINKYIFYIVFFISLLMIIKVVKK